MTQTYVVQPGDTLWAIAEYFYGDGTMYTTIFNANRDKIDDPDKIRPGMKLTIP